MLYVNKIVSFFYMKKEFNLKLQENYLCRANTTYNIIK